MNAPGEGRRHQPGQPAASVVGVQGGGEGVNAGHGSKIEQAGASSLFTSYDEPEFLRNSNHQLGPIDADAGQSQDPTPNIGRHPTCHFTLLNCASARVNQGLSPE